MRIRHWVRRRVHELVDSGVWIALIAVVLTGAASRALGLRPTASLLALVALGTFAVYTLDHVVDRARDRGAKPRRERFVGRHVGVLLACALVAAGIAGLLAVSEGPEVTLLVSSVAVLAALHLPLKHLPGVKPTYIALAWLVVVVGLPVAVGHIPMGRAAGELGPLGLALMANVLACDAADREAEARWFGPGATWNRARAVAATGLLLGVFDRVALRPRSLVPLATLLALLPLHADPEYTGVFVDGALLVGGLGAWLWMS
jgi:4-hydroxybenzoate polyprenyltransferase